MKTHNDFRKNASAVAMKVKVCLPFLLGSLFIWSCNFTEPDKKESTALYQENGWTNFYRSDDVSAVAYFYLDKPDNELPILQPLSIRTYELRADQ